MFSFLSLTPEGPPISSFSTTSLTAQPSVSDQVIIWEVTVDPSILVLQNNYYYPLAPQTSQHPSSENLQAIMSETTPLSSQGTNPSKQSAGGKPITVEDSLEVISELISEIQAAESPNQEMADHSSISSQPSEKRRSYPLRISLASKTHSQLLKFLYCLLSIGGVSILPIQKDSKASPLSSTHQINELSLAGAKIFFKASKPNSGSLAGDFHLTTTLSFDELSSHPKLSIWMTLQGYYMVLCSCQSPDMVRIGFLSRVRLFVWREDMVEAIKSIVEWDKNPFQFHLYPGSISFNKKGVMAPDLMVAVKRDQIKNGLDFFCSVFDGESPLSPCSIPYLFLTLYQNQLTDSEHHQIIEDANLHIGQVSLVHLHGFKGMDCLVTLHQGIAIRLRTLLLRLRTAKSSKLFLQIEREADLALIVCAFHTVDTELTMSSMSNLSSHLRQCIMESHYDKAFLHQDYTNSALTRSIPIKKGKVTVSSKPIPMDIQEHTSSALSKMVSHPPKRSSSSNGSTTSTSSLSSTHSSSYVAATGSAPKPTVSSVGLETKCWFQAIEQKLNTSTS